MVSEVTKWCAAFFNDPIDNLSKDDSLSKLKGAAAIGAMILFFPVTAVVGGIYGISSGVDWFRGRKIEQDAPGLQAVDADVQKVFNRVNREIVEEGFRHVGSDVAIAFYITEHEDDIKTLARNPVSLVQLLPTMQPDLGEACIEQIYATKSQGAFVGALGTFIDSLTIKVKNKTLTEQEKEQLNFFKERLPDIIDKVEKLEGHQAFDVRECQQNLLGAIAKSNASTA